MTFKRKRPKLDLVVTVYHNWRKHGNGAVGSAGSGEEGRRNNGTGRKRGLGKRATIEKILPNGGGRTHKNRLRERVARFDKKLAVSRNSNLRHSSRKKG